MELGQKLKQARLDAGLSQRQLCGEQITRNMLSQIENGTAKPSMGTLTYLAGRLGKSVSFFLEEDTVVSPNHSLMESARRLYDQGSYQQALLVLESYQAPDPIFDREKSILQSSAFLAQAEQALEQKRYPYARQLLEQAAVSTAYCGDGLERRRLLLLGQIPGERVSALLPSLDPELMLRAKEAMSDQNWHRAACLLEAAQNRQDPQWNLLRGELHFQMGQYREAVSCFHIAEEAFPDQSARRLETCYKELEDYKQAYRYACKNRR